jgi:DNA ligase-1
MKNDAKNTFTLKFYHFNSIILKYDGERAQIHILKDGSMRVFSRNQEDNTTKYPDIIRRMPNAVKDNVVSAVIDSESVAWDTEKKIILPFQILSTRKVK